MEIVTLLALPEGEFRAALRQEIEDRILRAYQPELQAEDDLILNGTGTHDPALNRPGVPHA